MTITHALDFTVQGYLLLLNSLGMIRFTVNNSRDSFQKNSDFFSKHRK